MWKVVLLQTIGTLTLYCVRYNYLPLYKQHPELSGCITTLSEVANFCAAMDTLIDQDAETGTLTLYCVTYNHLPLKHEKKQSHLSHCHK